MVGSGKVDKNSDNVALLEKRIRRECGATLDFNTFAEMEWVTKFQIKKLIIAVICAAVDWDRGYTGLSGNTIGSIAAFCFVLCKMPTPILWFDLERTFGKHCLQISKVFWKFIDH